MQTTVAVPKAPYSIRTLPVLVALVAVFLMGGASGYLVKASAPAAAPVSTQAVSACPAGTHAEVWYTTHAWACVGNTAP